MATIRITGKLIMPNGEPAQFREVLFKRMSPDVAPTPGGGVVVDTIRAWTDINAEIDVELVPGRYVGEVADARGRVNYNFAFTLTGEEPGGSVTLEVLLSTSQFGDPVPYWFSAVTDAAAEVVELVGEANAAAEDARASADEAAASASLAQSAASNAQVASFLFGTWSALSAVTGAYAGQGASVLDTDAGSHTDPVVGGTVNNAGVYSWSASPPGWRRIGDTGLAGKASIAYVDDAISDLSEVARTGLASDVIETAVAKVMTGEERVELQELYSVTEEVKEYLVGGEMPLYRADSSGDIFSYISHDGYDIQSGRGLGSLLEYHSPDGAGASSVQIDSDGNVFSAIMGDGTHSNASRDLGGGVLSEWVHSIDGIALASIDKDGYIFHIIDDEGISTGSEGGGSGIIDHDAYFAFVEPIVDASKELFVSWVSNSSDRKVMEYRPVGGESWSSAASFRTRPFPETDGKWIHTVKLQGLSSGSHYEMKVIGTSFVDRFKVPPATDVNMALVSDWQLTDYSPAGRLYQFGPTFTEKGHDIAIWNGDMTNDDGIYDGVEAQKWYNFVYTLSNGWRTDGSLVPWIMIVGNHEGANPSGPGGITFGGNGILGMIKDIFSWTYSEDHPESPFPSVGIVRVGRELSIICLDTDHCTPIASQQEFLESALESEKNQRHVYVAGHVSPFNAHDWANQARYMRGNMWTVAQNYSGSNGPVIAWLSAHAHLMYVVPRMKMDIQGTPSWEDADRSFKRDPDGIYCLGQGQIGWPLDLPEWNITRTSIYDGLPAWSAILNRQTGLANTYEIHGDGVTNPSAPVAHFWTIRSNRNGFDAKAVSINGLNYYSITEME